MCSHSQQQRVCTAWILLWREMNVFHTLTMYTTDTWTHTGSKVTIYSCSNQTNPYQEKKSSFHFSDNQITEAKHMINNDQVFLNGWSTNIQFQFSRNYNKYFSLISDILSGSMDHKFNIITNSMWSFHWSYWVCMIVFMVSQADLTLSLPYILM